MKHLHALREGGWKDSTQSDGLPLLCVCEGFRLFTVCWFYKGHGLGLIGPEPRSAPFRAVEVPAVPWDRAPCAHPFGVTPPWSGSSRLRPAGGGRQPRPRRGTLRHFFRPPPRRGLVVRGARAGAPVGADPGWGRAGGRGRVGRGRPSTRGARVGPVDEPPAGASATRVSTAAHRPGSGDPW